MYAGQGMPALTLTTLIFFYNTWNVNKKDSLVKCDFISHLSSSIPVPDMDCTPSSAPIPRLWLMPPFSLYDLFWLHVCEAGLDVTEYTMGSSFSDKTSDSCWKMSHNDHKQQASKWNIRDIPNSQAFGNTSPASFLKTRTAICAFCLKAATSVV